MALSVAERQEFLAEPHTAALSVSNTDGRGPLTVPVWYDYSPGGDAWLVTGRDSVKTRLISAAGRFSLMVDRVSPTVRYVSVEGPAEVTAYEDEVLVAMARRYLPPEAVEPFMEEARATHGEQVVIRLRPEHWLSADLGGF